MLKKVKLSSLTPNPYRHFGTYEIQRDKVDALKESIEASGFWGETVIARPSKKGYELAFGHHRWQAAKEVYGDSKLVEISVRDLDNDHMLKMMARENNEIYDANAQQDIELIKAAIEAHANGEIHLPAPRGNGKGLLVNDYVVCQLTDTSEFTRESLSEYLALQPWRIREALGHLRQINDGITKSEQYADLSPTQAQEMKSQINRAKREGGEKVAKKVAEKVSKAMRSGNAVSGRGSGSAIKNTAKQVADEIINEATGKDDLPDIDEFITELCKDFARVFSPVPAKRLKTVIDNQSNASESQRYRLKQSLRSLARTSDRYADRVDAPEEALNDVKPVLEVVQ